MDEVLKGFKTGEAMRGQADGVLQAKLKTLEEYRTHSGEQFTLITFTLVKNQFIPILKKLNSLNFSSSYLCLLFII